MRVLLAGGAAFLALLATGCAHTAPATRTAQLWTGFADHPKGYLSDDSGLSADRLLPPPPKPGSEREAADHAVSSRTRGLEGSARWELAAQDAEVETPHAPYKAFACALGADIDPARAPRLTHLLGRVLPDVETVQHRLKQTVRPRPYVRQAQKVCVSGDALSRSSSYPSGHSAIGFAWGLILTQVAPDRQEAVLKRALAYGESRVVCGFHYPSDVEAGRVLGAGLVAHLGVLPAYQADLEAARREFAAIRASSPVDPARCAAEARTLEEAAY